MGVAQVVRDQGRVRSACAGNNRAVFLEDNGKKDHAAVRPCYRDSLANKPIDFAGFRPVKRAPQRPIHGLILNKRADIRERYRPIIR